MIMRRRSFLQSIIGGTSALFLPKSNANLIVAPSRTEEVGEILPSMTEVFQKEFRKCMDNNMHRREPYYIFVTGDWYANDTQFKLTITPMDFKPPVMLNTMLWRVDNKKGSIDEVWVLPKDAPVGPEVPLGEVDEGLMKIAKHFPLYYS